MIGIVVTGHGNFPQGLISTAKRIIGGLENVIVVATRPNEEPRNLRARVHKTVEKVASKEGVLVLTDVFGSSASSMCINMHKRYPIRVVTGVNLPMIFALATHRGAASNLDALASMVEEVGKKSINKW